MKRILFFFIISLITLAGRAQSYSDEELLPVDRNHWTVTVAYDVSLPGDWKAADNSIKMFKSGSGVSVGADYMMLFGRNFFFEPGARLYFDTYRYDDIIVSSDPSAEQKKYDPAVKKTGLRIPLTVGYKFDIFKNGSLLISTGPEPVIGFSARSKIDKELGDQLEENLYKDLMNRFDIAWDVRAAAVFNRFRIDVTGAFGMLDILKTDLTMHEYRLSIGLGYLF